MPALTSVKIIGGVHRGRKVPVLSREQLRPSGVRIRESLFNCLGQRLDETRCLDLFAGSGILGLEAASRGAAHVVLVEQQRQIAATIRTTAMTLNANTTVFTMSAEKFLSKQKFIFDLIFLDPPFANYSSADAWHGLITMIFPHLRKGGRVYCESAISFPPPPRWQVTTSKRTGRVFWQILQKLT